MVTEHTGGRGSDHTAQVVLRAGPPGSAGAPVTSANLADARPDPGEARRVQEHFAAAGFDVGPAYATSFSLSGPLDAFERTFPGDAGRLGSALRGELGDAELPLDGLPEGVRASITAVLVTRPPDFGPGNP